MINMRMKKNFFLTLKILLLVCVVLSANISTGTAQTPPQNPAAPSITYLPYVFRPGRQPVILGVESAWIDPNLLTKAKGVDAYWWRYFAFSWKGIEPADVNPSQYNWAAVNEQHLISASQNGFSVVATVKYTPYWAQAINDSKSIPCSPIKDDPGTIADFIEFVQALATRYTAPPYNILYWQFWNEPDVSPQVLGTGLYSSPFGCWGVETDPYYGGEKYALFLQIFSETIKSVNSAAQITNGGLLLDCDPTQDPTCVHGTFFEGLIKGLRDNGGISALDFASFHVYTRWYGDLYYDENWPGFSNRGGVLLGKIDLVREVMSNYGINPPKPLLITEGGLMCRRSDTNPLPSGVKCSDTLPPPEYNDDQAEYVIWLYVRAIAEDVSGLMWYTLNYQPYRHVGLLYTDGSPKPAYIAYQFLVSQIGDAQYVGTLNQYFPALRAYEFSKNSQRIWILWAPDQADHPINLPAGFQAAYDKLGTVITLPPGATTITINGPVYLILN